MCFKRWGGGIRGCSCPLIDSKTGSPVWKRRIFIHLLIHPFIPSLTHSLVHPSTHFQILLDTSLEPGSKLHHRTAESDPSLISGRSQSGAEKGYDGKSLQCLQMRGDRSSEEGGGEACREHQRWSHNGGKLGQGFGAQAAALESQNGGGYHLQRHHGLLERIYSVWGSVSGGEARMFCKPCSSRALNCLAVPFNGRVTLTKLRNLLGLGFLTWKMS